MASRRLSRSGVVAVLAGLLVVFGAGSALAQDSNDFYPAPPEEETQVLPDTVERAPDVAVQTDVLSATGSDVGTWGLIGLGALGVGAAVVLVTRRKAVNVQ